MNHPPDAQAHPSWWQQHGLEIAAVGLPLLIYIGVTFPLRHWIVDDAGITFAYARSLANGHGLVAQPGVAPVEGYSNPLWLLAMTPFFLFKLFHPYWIPKLLALILTAATYWNIHRALMKFTGQRLVSLVTLTCLSLNSSFVVWSCSGLENSLLAALTSLLLWHLLSFADQSKHPPSAAFNIGLIVVGIALTRPDGIAYVATFPLLLTALALSRRFVSWRDTSKQIAQYMAGLLPYGGFLLFRYAYFGSWLPNTAAAKGTPTLGTVIDALTLQGAFLEKWRDLSASLFGATVWVVIPLLALIALAVILIRRDQRPRHLVLLLMLGTSWLVHMILPNDWMGEFRFATPFFVFYYTLLGLVCFRAVQSLSPNKRIRVAAITILTAMSLGGTVLVHAPRLERFYRGPVVSFSRIADAFAFKFNRYADKLDIQDASVMLPDIGAVLYYSHLRVYDLVGLTDTLVARSLRNNKPVFYDYVFETAKPTFIHIHGNWTYASDLDADKRFRRDYIPINEFPDKWIKDATGREMMSGDYVRKEAVSGKEDLLDGL